MLRKDFDDGKISKEEYFKEIGNNIDNPAPNIQMIIFDNNFLNNLHDVNKRIRAIKEVDFTWGWQWHMSQLSMKYLDIVLPGPIVAFETSDQVFPFQDSSRYCAAMSGSANYFAYQQKCVDPPSEVRPKMWVWTQIAKRLGIAEKFNPRMADIPLDRWDEAVEELHKEAYEKWAASSQTAAVLGYEPPTWEEFLKKPILRVPIRDPHYAFKEYIDAGLNPFRTPSGKIEFYSNKAAGAQWGVTEEYTGQLDPLPRWEPSYMPGPAYNSFFHPKANEYPLLLVTPVSTYRQHSSNDMNPWLRGDLYRHSVWINLADAKSRGIVDGDRVHVFSETGELYLPAFVTSRVIPGTVVIHHGAWYLPTEAKTELSPFGVDSNGAPCLLLDDEYLPHLVGAMLNTGLVEIEKALEAEVK